MVENRFAFIKASWHSEIVDKALEGFCSVIPDASVDVFSAPGAFEMPLIADDIAGEGKHSAIIAAAFVVDGGIYRHEFVAQSVLDGLMQVGLNRKLPVLSVSLTPHHYQETEHHTAIFRKHFIQKGTEAANAALAVLKTRDEISAL